nr:MAG TPA: hypothetical protein [Caudoviricetes sp.]
MNSISTKPTNILANIFFKDIPAFEPFTNCYNKALYPYLS